MVMNHASKIPFAEAPVRPGTQDEFVPDVIEELAGRENRFRNSDKVEEADHLRQRLRDMEFFNFACCGNFGVQDRIGLKHFLGQLRVIKAVWMVYQVHRCPTFWRWPTIHALHATRHYEDFPHTTQVTLPSLFCLTNVAEMLSLGKPTPMRVVAASMFATP